MCRLMDRRQLRRIAQHQQRYPERHQVAAKFGIDHRAFVDDDERGLRRRRLVPEIEARDFLAAFAGLVDQAVNGGGAFAALAAHHQRGLAGEGGEQNLAVDRLGEVPRQRGLAGAGVAEQPEGLGRAALPGLGLKPGRDRLEGGVLMRSKDGHCGPEFAGRNVSEEQKENKLFWRSEAQATSNSGPASVFIFLRMRLRPRISISSRATRSARACPGLDPGSPGCSAAGSMCAACAKATPTSWPCRQMT